MVKTIKDIELKGAHIIMRVDFNVPMKDGCVQDDARILAAIPTIKYLMKYGVHSITLMSHLGDPEKDAKKAEEKAKKQGIEFDKEKYISSKHMLSPVAEYLDKKLKWPVHFISDISSGYEEVQNCKEGSIFMLENTRFDKRETSKDEKEREEFAKELAKYGTIFVNDAFGTAHREHASTCTIAKFTEHAVAGFLMEKEILNLSPLLQKPKRPFTAIIGGAKVSSKISVLKSLAKRVDNLIIGGGMSYTFLKAQGRSIGASLFESDYADVAKELLDEAASRDLSKERELNILLPIDSVCCETFSENALGITMYKDIPDSLIAMDIGGATVEEYKKVIALSKTIVWNGPMGVFEFETFARGTEEIAKAVAEATENGAMSVVGGGDSVAALNKFGLADKMTHVSTGGGASLEYLEGKVLPGIACLEQKK